MRAALLALLVLAGCERPPDGPAIELTINNRFGESFHYGVLEVRSGGCESEEGALIHRARFPAEEMEGLDPGVITLPRGEEVCFRVFAVIDAATYEPRECTLIAAGAKSVTPGVTPEVVIAVLRLDANAAADAGAMPSAREEANERYAPGICAPTLVSPFDGEHLGSTRPEICDRGRCALRPRLRFRHVAEARTYCIEMRPSRDGAPAEQVSLPVDVGGALVETTWDQPGFAETDASYGWRVRACTIDPSRRRTRAHGCPDDTSALFTDGAERCTGWSEVRELVTRPWGDLDGDERSDFVLSDPSGEVHAFLSSDSSGATESYEICGRTFYHRALGENERRLCDANVAVPIATGAYGAAVQIADLGGDERGEIIVTAPNCLESAGPADVAGGFFVYRGDGAELLGTHWFTEPFGTDAGTSGYGLHVQPYRRSSSNTVSLFVLGVLVTASGSVAFRMAPLTVGPSFTLEAGEIFADGGYTVGLGDLNADARQDVVGQLGARLSHPSDDSFVVRRTGFESQHILVAGDLDDDARAEMLNLGQVDRTLCNQSIVMQSFDEERGLVDSGGRPWMRAMPLTGEADCTLPPPMPVDPRCSTIAEPDRPCPIDDAACLVCPMTPASEGAFATIAPRGTEWSGGEPVVALMYRDRLRFYDRSNSSSFGSVERPVGTSSCMALIMRGALDLDGDGYNDFLVLDPDGDRLHVVCGAGAEPVIERVETSAGVPFDTTAAGCNLLWSLAP